MYTYFLILATQLTDLSLKANQMLDPYLNFDYLQLTLPTRGFIATFTELLSQTLNFVILLLRKLFKIKNDALKLVLY